MQQSGHCSSCAASAVRGLLAHLDAAALDAAAAAADDEDEDVDGCAAAAATTALTQPWTLLSMLLVQLAAEAAADSSNEPAAAGVADGTAGSSNQAAGSSRQLWQPLQSCFADRQDWWEAAGLADPAEVAAVFGDHADQIDQHIKHQVSDQMYLFEHADSWRDLEGQQQPLSQQDIQRLLGLDGSTDAEQQQRLQQTMELLPLLVGNTCSQEHQQGEQQEVKQPQQQPEQMLGLPPMLVGDTASQQQQQEVQQQQQLFQMLGLPPLFVGDIDSQVEQQQRQGSQLMGVLGCSIPTWGPLQQLVCCKAIALMFVLGPFNSYSLQALQAVGEAADAEAASIAVAQMGHMVLPHMQEMLLQPAASLDNLDAAAVGAR
jgi:hypothetical protein